jgi:hypothetical protein
MSLHYITSRCQPSPSCWTRPSFSAFEQLKTVLQGFVPILRGEGCGERMARENLTAIDIGHLKAEGIAITGHVWYGVGGGREGNSGSISRHMRWEIPRPSCTCASCQPLELIFFLFEL